MAPPRPPTDICSNGFSGGGAEESQPWTKYDACQHEHAKLQYDKEIQSTTIDMWEEYEEWEKAAENQGLKEMFAQVNEEDGSQTLTAVQYYMRLDDYNANMEKYQQEREAEPEAKAVAKAKAKPEAKRINCANGGCPRRAVDLCFQCGAPHCEAHLALCEACRRGAQATTRTRRRKGRNWKQWGQTVARRGTRLPIGRQEASQEGTTGKGRTRRSSVATTAKRKR